MLQFQCWKCDFLGPTLEGHKCVAARPNQLLAPGPSLPELVPELRLAKARAVLSEASERVGAQVGEEAFRQAAVHGQAFVKDGRVLKREEVLAPAKLAGFDRAAYQREYMRGWRARRKARPT